MIYVDNPTFAMMPKFYCHQNIWDMDVLQMHGEMTVSRWVNRLDGLLLRCFVCALLTTLSFMHITCAHIWKRMQNMFHCCMKMSMGVWGCLVYYIAYMYVGRIAPSHTRSIPGKGENSPLWFWR